jgi:hypothetical protein
MSSGQNYKTLAVEPHVLAKIKRLTEITKMSQKDVIAKAIDEKLEKEMEKKQENDFVSWLVNDFNVDIEKPQGYKLDTTFDDIDIDKDNYTLEK